MEHGDVVDQVVEELIVCTQQDGTCQRGMLTPQLSAQPLQVSTDSIDMLIKAEAADKPWRRSKTAYFHPNARPSEYIRDILSDPYFNHVDNWYPPVELRPMQTR